jgi:ABC-2 type transport system permease protein
MKALGIARKSLLELLREPLIFWLLLLFPAVFVGFYYIAFGRTDEGFATYLSLLAINEDAGATMPDGSYWQAGEDLLAVVREAQWEGDPVFDLALVSDRRAAEIALRERKVALLLAIPPDFTDSLLVGASGIEGLSSTSGIEGLSSTSGIEGLSSTSGIEGLSSTSGIEGLSSTSGIEGLSPATVSLVGDPGSDSFVFAHSFLNWLTREYAQGVGGWQDDPLDITYEFLPGTGTMSDFDFGVVGLVVFGIMFVIITTSTVMVRENVAGTLLRLRLTRAGAADLLLGVTLAQMVAAAVQMPITFGAALAMGFRNNGSLLLAIGIGLLLNLSAVGLGLIVAAFARNDGDAVNIGSAVMVPMVFLTDAMYPMPAAPLFTIAGRTIEAYDLLPASHAAVAMRRVLIFGDGLANVAFELVAMTVLSLLLLGLGIVLYRRLRLRAA